MLLARGLSQNDACYRIAGDRIELHAREDWEALPEHHRRGASIERVVRRPRSGVRVKAQPAVEVGA